jgi:hypothetical protein
MAETPPKSSEKPTNDNKTAELALVAAEDALLGQLTAMNAQAVKQGSSLAEVLAKAASAFLGLELELPPADGTR